MENETFTVILGIVLLIWGLLQIILFFKLWGMTNNVKNINKLISTGDRMRIDIYDQNQIISECDRIINEAKRFAYIGKRERAKELLLGAMYDCEIKLKECPATTEEVSNMINAALKELGLI